MKWFKGGLHSPTQDHDDCHDDVMLPPGGRPRPAPAIDDGPDPCYIDHHGRDLRIDLLRGFFVVAMIVDHVRGPSPLYLLTGGNRTALPRHQTLRAAMDWSYELLSEAERCLFRRCLFLRAPAL